MVTVKETELVIVVIVRGMQIVELLRIQLPPSPETEIIKNVLCKSLMEVHARTLRDVQVIELATARIVRASPGAQNVI